MLNTTGVGRPYSEMLNTTGSRPHSEMLNTTGVGRPYSEMLNTTGVGRPYSEMLTYKSLTNKCCFKNMNTSKKSK
jgi:hypothetical protein